MIKSEQHSGSEVITGNNTINSPKCLYTEIAKEDEQLQELHNPRHNGIITTKRTPGILAPNTFSVFSVTAECTMVLAGITHKPHPKARTKGITQT